MPPTWHRDIAPLISKHCASCHQDGGIAPFALTDYDAVRTNADRIEEQISHGTMPPFDAVSEADCAPRFGWFDDPRLSQAEQQTLEAWITADYPVGTPRDFPPPPDPALAPISTSVTPVEGFVASGDRDQFACFLLDPELSEDTWLTGLQVRPGVAPVVHHVIIAEVGPGPDLDTLIARHGIGHPFDCAETPASSGIHIWVPGNQPMQLPHGVAVAMPAGSMLVTSIHYHPNGTDHPPDLTALDLQLSTTWPRAVYGAIVVGNATAAPQLLPGPDDDGGPPEFKIPANAPDHVERMQFPMSGFDDLDRPRILTVTPHMHLAGAHISAKLERSAARDGAPQDECVANGGWNFDWQRTYTYDAPLDALPPIHDDDVVDITCTWNNTIENPFVQRLMHDAGLVVPKDLYFGQQTTDEMCQVLLGVVVDAPAH